ncbi:MAG: TonB-dependent receptor [Acidobacteriota bacterium]|nr:TonB-dependent receptor [Acidobacteriota bacterium]
MPLFCACAFAQTATIQGSVSDPSNAAIAGVNIRVTNVSTGVVTNVETNQSGLYSAPLLPPGSYSVEAEKAGFARAARTGLQLDVSQTARVDFTLKIGAVTESVQVSAAALAVDSETSTVGQVINTKQILDLPLNGRNYLDLARLTTGVAPSFGSRTDSKGTFSALGQHGLQTNILLDGVDNNSRFSGGQLGYEAQAVTPSIDAVQEFKVITNNNSAEYGFRMGGTVIVSTKSGTNGLHGSAYEFLRNDKLDATNFFGIGQPKPAFRRNQFGATAGGPVIRNRTFFFVSYEGTRIRMGETDISTVPTAAERGGDFSAVGLKPIFDPATTRLNGAGQYVRDRFPGNMIPASRFDPVSAKAIALYPLPNLGGIANNYFLSPGNRNDTNEIDTRGDHNFSEKERFFVRYSRRRNDVFQPGHLPEPADGGQSQTIGLTAHEGVANLNSTFTPALNNELRFGISHTDSILDIPFTQNFDPQLGILGVPDLGDATKRGYARFSPSGYSELGPRSFWPNANNLDVLHIADALLYTRGRHIFKTGVEFRRESIYRLAARLARGQFGFDGSFTQDPNSRGNTGDGVADFLLGTANSAQIGNLSGETALAHNWATYFQDDWHVTSKLTLNLGVRWDWFGPPSYPNSIVGRYDVFPSSPTYKTFILPKNGGDCGCEQNWANFAPRIGFAWQATPKTVFRSGYGIFYGEPDSISHDGDGRFAVEAPSFTEITFPSDRLLQPALIVSQGFPPGLLPTTVLRPNVSLKAAYAQMPNQYAEQWFADVQRQLPLDTVLTISYLGSGTHHLAQTRDVNQPLLPGPGSVQSRRVFPQFSNITLRDALGNASYNALGIKAEKRYTQGVTLLMSYTYSHAIDDAVETDTNAGGEGLQSSYDVARSRGNSVFDVRHIFVTSAVYDLPFGRGRKWINGNRALDLALGGWQLGGILSMRSGVPFTPLVSTDIANVGGASHPDYLRNGNLPADRRSIDRWFDVTAFGVPAAFTFGNAGRNILYGPRFRNLDAKLGKNFQLNERLRMEFRAEFFNATNTPHFNLPNANVNQPAGGKISSAMDPRQMQFGLKLIY